MMKLQSLEKKEKKNYILKMKKGNDNNNSWL